MSTPPSTSSITSRGGDPAAASNQNRVTIRGQEMDPSLWEDEPVSMQARRRESAPSSQLSSSSDPQSPPAKKARLQASSSSSKKKRATKPKTAPKKKPSTKKTRAAPRKETSSKKNGSAQASSKVTTTPLPQMRWTVALTALAIETRFKNPRILKKFSVTTADTKLMRAKWEAALHTFLERALIENAWGEGEKPRQVTVEQFKNKLNAVRASYRAKRTRLLATGNTSVDDTSGSEDEAEERQYAEMPTNFFLSASGDNGDNISENLTCDPLDVDPKYRSALGKELTALWPLLCDVFSGNPGCTGEPIIESGVSRRPTEDEDGDASLIEGDDLSDEECSDSSSQARAEAKQNAKSSSQSSRPLPNRPVDVVAESLRAGFGSIERILTSRQAPTSTNPSMGDVNSLVVKLTSTIEAANTSQLECMEVQREASLALRQTMENLQQMSASAVELFAKMKEQICGINV